MESIVITAVVSLFGGGFLAMLGFVLRGLRGDNARLEAKIDAGFASVDQRFARVDEKFEMVHARINDLVMALAQSGRLTVPQPAAAPPAPASTVSAPPSQDARADPAGGAASS